MARLPLVSPLDRILFLKAQPYLLGQPPEVLTVLASYTEERFYSRGSLIRSQNEPVEEILFLVEGRVGIAIRAAGPGGSREVTAPGIVGLPHYFAAAERPPGVRAVEDTLCLVLATSDLDQILEDHFSLILNIVRRSAEEALRCQRALALDRPPEPGFANTDHHDTPVALDLVQRLALARRSPLFQRTNLTVLGQLIRFEDVQILSAGESLWKEGDPIGSMALVLDGLLETRGPYGRGVAPGGATIGAWEILNDGLRKEAWVAVSPSRVLSIRRDLFIDLLEDHYDFASEYLRCCCRLTLEGWQALAAQAARNGGT